MDPSLVDPSQITETISILDKNLLTALTMAIGGFAPALGIGWIASAAMTAIGRNPEAASRIQTPMVLAVAFTEAIAIYSLVIALIIKFVA